MSARAFWWTAAALAFGLGHASTGCRDLYVCHGSELCEAAPSVSGAGGLPEDGPERVDPSSSVSSGQAGYTGYTGHAGGQAGESRATEAAGAAGLRACLAPLENCDATWLNGCEADLSGDAYDCGKCGNVCEGVCARSSCHLPIALSEQAIQPLGGFAVAADYLYFMWGEPAGPYRLSRIGHLSGVPELVADNLPKFSALLATPERLFLWGYGEHLHSWPFFGALRDEGIAVSGVAFQSGVVYAVQDGALLERVPGSEPCRPTRFSSQLGPSTDLWPIDVDGQLVVVRALEADEEPRYEVLLVEHPQQANAQTKLLASGTGTLLRVRSSAQYVYWLIQSSRAGAPFELHRHSVLPNTADQLVAREHFVTDFALDSDFIYLARTLSIGYELEVALTESIAEKFHFGSRFALSFPESVGGFLWYFDTSRSRLRRVDLQLDSFL